ncbi:MAG TPA: ABC transporter ATP-binding protein [Bacillales bacterium]|nr:ABC transporter ATP-binding protein [Bacillales bacterium]
MNPLLLKIDHLTGGYSRSRPVLHDISLDVHEGEVVGLIGLNGAGKSTTIKHVLGMLEPISGSIELKGQTFLDAKETYRQHYVYIPETPTLYDQLTLAEHLQLTAMAYGIDKKTYEQRLPDLLKEFRMENKLKWFPGHFSKGMRQKVMIMCAFLVQPSLYIVDEPFIGLDPIGIQSFLDLMLEMKGSGAGVLMSTHILSTAEQYCDRFVILHDGRIKMKGTISELRKQIGLPGASLHEIYILATKGDES